MLLKRRREELLQLMLMQLKRRREELQLQM